MRLFRALVSSVVAATATAYVPSHMELPATWTDVGGAALAPLEFKSEAASALEGGGDANVPSRVSESACMSAADVIKKHSGKNGCIAFAVRRPG